jgi:hypothetical protein
LIAATVVVPPARLRGIASLGNRLSPPPGWPPVPDGFVPPPGWQPDSAWPPAPPGWQLWVQDDTQASTLPAAPPLTPGAHYEEAAQNWNVCAQLPCCGASAASRVNVGPILDRRRQAGNNRQGGVSSPS